MTTIGTVDELRACYPPAIERARLKTLRKLDKHCRAFIARSPFLCLGTSSTEGSDVTPRGDAPGFVHVIDDVTIAIPDWRGNNRLDSLANIVLNPNVGLLFLIPGVDETLRVNGSGVITTSSAVLSRWDHEGRHPSSVLVVTVSEAYMHCGKALIRSRLWKEDYRIERTELPAYGQMLKDHTQIEDTAEQIQESVLEAYRDRLY
jgi:PPOX class probable FMN-dependent enzyme